MTDEKPTKPNCYKCKYRGKVPGSAHSRCHHPANEAVLGNSMLGLAMALSGGRAPQAHVEGLTVVGHELGHRGGWFAHPHNFDPVWLVSCNGFEAKAADVEAVE